MSENSPFLLAVPIVVCHGAECYEVPVGRFRLLDALLGEVAQETPNGTASFVDRVERRLAIDDLFEDVPARLSTLVALLEGKRPPCATWDDLSALGDDLEYLQCDEWPPWMDAALADCAGSGVLTGPMVQRVQRRRGDRWILDGVARRRVDPRWVQSITEEGAAHDGVLSSLVRLRVLHAAGNPMVTKVAPFAATLTELDASGPNCGLLRCPFNTPLPRLTWLNLSANEEDEGRRAVDWLQAVANAAPNLRHLDLSSCFRVTDEGLACVSKLVQLTSVNLACVRIDAGLAHLSGLVQLTSIDLSWCAQVNDASLAHLAQLAQLTSINLKRCVQVTDVGLAHLSRLGRMRAIVLRRCARISHLGLAHLVGLVELTSVDVARCPNVDDMGLTHLSRMVKLTALDLNYSNVGNAGLAHLAGLIQLTSLNLASCTRIDDAGVAHLSQLAQLTALDLKNCRITDVGVSHLASLVRLASITLDCNNIRDWGVAPLSNLVQLKSVSLHGCSCISEAGMAPLSRLVRLTSLKLTFCRTGLTHISCLHRLTSVVFDCSFGLW